eukprot:1158815-Pyramimonas_sp.AAC.1
MRHGAHDLRPRVLTSRVAPPVLAHRASARHAIHAPGRSDTLSPGPPPPPHAEHKIPGRRWIMHRGGSPNRAEPSRDLLHFPAGHGGGRAPERPPAP